MTDLLPFVIVGITTGSVYALAALGLVVTYRTSGVFNFAHGAIAMGAAFLFDGLRGAMPTALAIVLVVVFIGPLAGVLTDRVLFRHLAGSQPITYIVASLGLFVAIQALIIAVYGGDLRQTAPFFPSGTVAVLGMRPSYAQLGIVATSLFCAAGLFVFLQRTAVGLKMRAVVDDGRLSELSGVNGANIRTLSWMIGYAFAALSGILIAPQIGLDVAALTLLVVASFAAAVVGRLTSPVMTYVGGLVVGLVGAIATAGTSYVPALRGVPASMPFIVLFAVLVFSRRDKFRSVIQSRSLVQRPAWVSTQPVKRKTAIILVVIAALVPLLLSDLRLGSAAVTLAYLLIFASLGFLLGLARQVTLAHAAFVGLGAIFASNFISGGMPFLAAMVLSAFLVTVVGIIVAIPALRLSGLFLALATIGFGLLVQDLFFPSALGFGTRSAIAVPRPSILGLDLSGDIAFYYFMLIFVALCVLGLQVLAHGRLGHLARAAADSPDGLRSLGISPSVARVTTFAVASFAAGLAGVLYGAAVRSIAPTTFDFFHSLSWVVLAVMAGVNSLLGWSIAAIALGFVPSFLPGAWITTYLPILFGVQAIVLAQKGGGLAGETKEIGRKLVRRLQSKIHRDEADDPSRDDAPPHLVESNAKP